MTTAKATTTPGKIVYTKTVSDTVPNYLKQVLGDNVRWQLKRISVRVTPRIGLVSSPIYRVLRVHPTLSWQRIR